MVDLSEDRRPAEFRKQADQKRVHLKHRTLRSSIGMKNWVKIILAAKLVSSRCLRSLNDFIVGDYLDAQSLQDDDWLRCCGIRTQFKKPIWHENGMISAQM